MLDKAKVLALTATATKKAQKQIISALCMVKPKVIAESPDRYALDVNPSLCFIITAELAMLVHLHSGGCE